MRILHVITTLDIGGAEKQLLSLARQQIACGNSVAVIPVKGKSELAQEFINAGVELDERISNKNFISQALELRKNIDSGEFDIVHSHLPRAQLLVSIAFGKRFNIVVTRHDAMPFFAKGSRWISNFLWKFVQERSTKVIVISDSIRKKMIGRGEVKLTDEVKIVHYGYAREIIDPSIKLKIEKKHEPLSQNRFTFGTVSRLVEEKNLSTLIEAFANLHEKHEATELVIVGYGPLRFKLEEEAKRFSISHAVLFAGKQLNISEWMNSFDAFVLASKTEGFGLVLLEAMWAGLPIVASYVDAIPEVLGNEGGLFFDPNSTKELTEKLSLVLRSEVSHPLSQHSQERLKLFTIEECERKIRKIYLESIDKIEGVD